MKAIKGFYHREHREIEWRRVPWPLWVFLAIELLAVVRLEFRVDGPVLAMVLYPVLAFVWLYFLLRGVHWVWLATLALQVLGFAIELISGTLQWWGAVIGLAELGLLLHPATRGFFSTEQSQASAGTALDHSG